MAPALGTNPSRLYLLMGWRVRHRHGQGGRMGHAPLGARSVSLYLSTISYRRRVRGSGTGHGPHGRGLPALVNPMTGAPHAHRPHGVSRSNRVCKASLCLSRNRGSRAIARLFVLLSRWGLQACRNLVSTVRILLPHTVAIRTRAQPKMRTARLSGWGLQGVRMLRGGRILMRAILLTTRWRSGSTCAARQVSNAWLHEAR